MENLFDQEAEQSATLPEIPGELATEATPLYPPPDRACLVCGERKWQWNPEKRVYACGGNLVAHDEYAAWHRATFPWLMHPGA